MLWKATEVIPMAGWPWKSSSCIDLEMKRCYFASDLALWWAHNKYELTDSHTSPVRVLELPCFTGEASGARQIFYGQLSVCLNKPQWIQCASLKACLRLIYLKAARHYPASSHQDPYWKDPTVLCARLFIKHAGWWGQQALGSLNIVYV